jgi:integral membrane protein
MVFRVEAIGFFCGCHAVKRIIFCRMPNWKTSVGRVRICGTIEGVSFIVLMGVAMPLKYLAGMPTAVKWPGWIHGILFVVYCLAILMALVNGRLSFGKSVLAFVASLLPFGPFLIDRTLAKDEAEEISDGAIS